MRRIILFAMVAVAMLSCTYGGTNNNNGDATEIKTDGTNNTEGSDTNALKDQSSGDRIISNNPPVKN